MTIKEQIMADVKEAMKSKQQDRLTTLRGIHSAIKNKEIEVRPKELTEEDTMSVLKKLAKQRKDSIEQYENAQRQDLADKEKMELEIIQSYLPQPLSQDELEKLVDQAIEKVGADSMKQMGAVMKEVMALSAGRADNKQISEIVKSKLQ